MRKFLDVGTASIAAAVGALHAVRLLEDDWALLALLTLYGLTARDAFRRTQVLLGSFVGTAPLGLTVLGDGVPSPPFWVWALFLYWVLNLGSFRNISTPRGFLAGGAAGAFFLIYLVGILLPTLRGDAPNVHVWPPLLATATFIGTLWFSEGKSAGRVAFLPPMIALAYLVIGLDLFFSLVGLGNPNRLDLFYNNPIIFGSFLLIIFTVVWRNVEKVKVLRPTLVHTCILVFGIYSTGSRAAFLGVVFLIVGFLVVGLARRLSTSPRPIKFKLSRTEVNFLLTAGAGFGTSAALWAIGLWRQIDWGLAHNVFIVAAEDEANARDSLNRNVRLAWWASAARNTVLWGRGFPDEPAGMHNGVLFLSDALGIIAFLGVLVIISLSVKFFLSKLGQRLKPLDLVVAGTIMVPFLFHDEIFFPAPFFLAGLFFSSRSLGRLRKT